MKTEKTSTKKVAKHPLKLAFMISVFAAVLMLLFLHSIR